MLSTTVLSRRSHRTKRISDDRRRRRMFEQLENRLVMAADITWDGGGGDSDWHNALNWDGDVVPTSAHTVEINLPSSETIAITTANAAARALNSTASLFISGHGSLTVFEPSLVTGSLTIDTGALSAFGSTALFTAAGATSLVRANLSADGGQLNLSAATALNNDQEQQRNITAVNGGHIDLSGVITISGGVGQACGQCGPRTLTVQATNGGVIDFGNAAQAIHRTQFIVGPDSSIDLPLLTSISGGEISVSDNGVFSAPSLTTMQFMSVSAFSGSVLDLGTVTNYQSPSGFPSIHANNSHIDLSGLTTMAGGSDPTCGQCAPFNVTISAVNAGTIDISSLTAATGIVNFSAAQQGSEIDLASLVSLNGGSLAVSNSATLNVPVIETIRNASLIATSGGFLDLHTASLYESPSGFPTIHANNSHIDLSGLTTMAGGSDPTCGQCAPFHVTVSTTNAGTIDISSLTATTGELNFSATQANSQIDLASLVSMQGGSLNVSNSGSLNLPVIDTIRNASLFASADALLDLHTASVYQAPSGFHFIDASTNGRINLSGLSTFAGGSDPTCGQCAPFSVVIAAHSGGVIDVSQITQSTGKSDFRTDGANSVVDLSSLQSMAGGSLTVFDVGTLLVPQLGHVINVNLYAASGGSLDLSSLTQYETSNAFPTISAVNGGYLNLSNLASVLGGQGAGCGQCAPYRMTITTGNAGVIDLHSDTTTFDGLISLFTSTGTVQAGTIVLSPSSTLEANGSLQANLVTAGLLRPQLSGSLHVLGDFMMTSTGILQVDIGGLAPGTQYDQVQVTGHASLDGTLSVSRSYMPAPGETFDILTFASRSCDFHTKNGLDLGGGQHLASSYSGSMLTLTAGFVPDSGLQCSTAPTINDQSFSLNENSDVGTFVGVAVASDPDLPIDTLTWSILSGNLNGAFAIDATTGQITVSNKTVLDYESITNFNLEVQVTDASGETDEAIIAIELLDLQATVSIAETDGVEGDVGTSTLSFPIHIAGDVINVPFNITFETADGTADASSGDPGAFDYLPSAGVISIPEQPGAAPSVSVTIHGDQLAESNETFFVLLTVVTGSNDVVITNAVGEGAILNDDDAPVAHAGGPYAIDEGDELILDASLTSDLDDGAAGLTYSWDIDGDGDYDENISSSSATITLTPNQLAVLGLGDGPISNSMKLLVSDGANTHTATTTLLVNNVDPTIITLSVSSSSIVEGLSVTVSGEFSDPALGLATEAFAATAQWSDGQTTVVHVVGNAFSTSRNFADDGPGAQPDTLTVDITILDDDFGTDTRTSQMLTVSNADPTATDNAYETAQATSISGNVLSDGIADHDPAGALDPLTVSAVNGDAASVDHTVSTAHGTLTVDADGSFTYQPATIFTGTEIFTYSISDGDGGIATATVVILVAAAPAGSIVVVPDTCCSGKDALLITGGSDGDMIEVEPASNSAALAVTINGVTTMWPKPSGRIIVIGGDGDDDIQIAGAISNSVWLYGNDGNDRLNAGNVSHGGNLLIGGAGDDHLLGGNGRDILVGGEGADKLNSNSSDDILIAGFTSQDERDSAGHEQFWCSVILEWTNDDPFLTRVHRLRTGSGSTAVNLLDTVFDDLAADDFDVLQGSSGNDWFIFDGAEDKVSGQIEASN